MAHKALISGTAYDIVGGKTLVNGTEYSIAGGRTLVNGTGYDIGFRESTPYFKIFSGILFTEEEFRFEIGMTWKDFIHSPYYSDSMFEYDESGNVIYKFDNLFVYPETVGAGIVHYLDTIENGMMYNTYI